MKGDGFDVVVVGGGVIGLTTARECQRAGARVCVVADRPPTETTSALAAAVWYPTETDEHPAVLRWAGETFEEFARQAADGVPGVRMCPTRMLLREPELARPWWADAVPDFRCSTAPSPWTGAWEFTVPLVEMPIHLAWLEERFRRAGGVLRECRIDSFVGLAGLAPIVINATGLLARNLCGDEAVTAVRGQVVITDNPGLTRSVRDESNPAGRTYVHPRRNEVVVGGTYEWDRWTTAVDVDQANAMLSRARRLVPELRGSRVRAHRVGLRPARRGGARVELDDRCSEPIVVHNYGHGGAGMTLSWGCARRAAELAARASGG